MLKHSEKWRSHGGMGPEAFNIWVPDIVAIQQNAL